VNQGFAAAAAVENEFNCFFEGDAFAFGAAAVVEVMSTLVLESYVEFFENSPFLA